MADHKITDFVDENAIKSLKKLASEMQTVKTVYTEVAEELLKGLSIKVNNLEDLRKPAELYAGAQKKAAETAEKHNKIVQEQQRVLAQTTNTISRHLMEVERENKAQREAYTEHEKVRQLLSQVNGTYEQHVATLVRTENEIKQYKAQMKELEKAHESGRISTEAYNQRQAELTTLLRQVQAEKQSVQTLMKNEEKEAQAVEGSYTHLSQQLELLKKAYKNMTAEEKASPLGKDMEKSIQNLDAHLKDLAADMGEFQRNTGNYAIAGGSVKKELKELVMEIANLTVAYRAMSDAEKASAEGQEMKRHIDELTERAGVMKDAVADTQAAIKNAASDTRGFDQISEGIKLCIDGFGLATGAAQMLGLSEEDLAEVQAKLQAAIVASNAVTSIQTSLQEQSALMQGVLAVKTWAAKKAKDAETASTLRATIAQKAFNLVAKANPYVLLAMAIVTVVGALVAFTKGKKEAAKAEAEHQKALEESRKKAQEYKEAITKTVADSLVKYKKLQMQWKELKGEHEKNKWIKENQNAFHGLGLAINNVNDAERAMVSESEAVIKALIAKARATAMMDIYMEEYKKKLDRDMAKKRHKEENATETDVAGIGTVKLPNFGDPALQDTQWAERQRQAAESVGEALEDVGKAYDEEIDANLKRMEKELHTLEQDALDASKALGSLNYTGDGDKSKGDNSKDKVKKEEDTAAKILRVKLQSVQDQLAVEQQYSSRWMDLKTEELDLQMQQEMSARYKNYEQGLISEEEYHNQIMAVRAKFAKEEKDLIIEAKLSEVAAKQAIADAAFQNYMAQLKTQYAEELQAAGDNAEARDAALRKYEKATAEAMEQYAKETAQRQIDALEELVNMEGLTADQREQLEAELSKAKIDLANAVADAEINASNRAREAEEEDYKKRIEAAQQWLNTAKEGISAIAGLANALYDGRIQKLDEEQEALDEKYEADTERNQTAADEEQERIADLVEKKVITEEEGEARKQAAAANSAAKQKKLDEDKAKRDEELEKKKAELKQKQAVWDKANSIAQAGIATALAITQALPNIALAAIAGAMGAIQVATILATPIPKYRLGTSNHPGGLAVVGDGGKQEVVDIAGSLFLTPDKPTVVDLPVGAKVYPDIDTVAEQVVGELMVAPKVNIDSGMTSVPVVSVDLRPLERKIDSLADIMRSIHHNQGSQQKAIAKAMSDIEWEIEKMRM